MARPKTKTEVTTLKLTPQLRAAWEAAATSERRSLANMFEIAILAYCQSHGIPIPEVEPPVASTPATAKPARKSKKATA
jgi:hypothetical protein